MLPNQPLPVGDCAMSTSPERHREWVDPITGSVRLPRRWHILPHEMVFGFFLGATWLRLWVEVGFSNTSTLLFGLYFLTLLWSVVWGQYKPSPYRWRVRLLCCLVVSTMSYFSLSAAVPLMNNPTGLETLGWHKDAVLQHWDVTLFGDVPRQLMLTEPGAWVTDMFMGCYLFFFYYLIGAQLFFFLKNLNTYRICAVGLCTVYALGYVGYTLMPAIGPVEELGLRQGGWLTELGGSFVAQRTNGVDVFPSLHMAASLFLLVFDWWYRRQHFWWALGPTVGLWVATVFLRYHYGVDVLAGIVLALACLWLTRWYANSSLCAEVEAECEARGKRPMETSEPI